MFINLRPNSEGRPEDPGIGEVSFREASSTTAANASYEAKMSRVAAACSNEFSDGYGYGDYGSGGSSAYVQRTFDDCVIFRKNGKMFIVDYVCDKDGNCSFGEPEEVEDTFTKVKDGATVTGKTAMAAMKMGKK